MLMKTWSARDETKEALKTLLTKKYKDVDAGYKMLRKVSSIDDAKKLVDEIWLAKSFANSIELELMRREFNNGVS